MEKLSITTQSLSTLLSPHDEFTSSPSRPSGSSFLSSDTDTSTPSSAGPLSQTSADSHEFSDAAAINRTVQAKAAPPMDSARRNTSYNHGAPLTDVAEEESPGYKRARSRTPSPIASSPTIGPESAPQSPPPWHQRHEHRLSESSILSNRSGSSDRYRESFEGLSGVSARLKADLAAMGDDQFDLDGICGKRSSVLTVGDDEQSGQALTSRAEKILANAKRRLTNMEGNLSRARGSLMEGPRPSPLRGEPREAGELYRTISQHSDQKYRPSRLFRESRVAQSPNPFPPGHSKNLSETAVPTQYHRHQERLEMRSASALEYGFVTQKVDTMFSNRPGRMSLSRPYRPLKRSQTSPLIVLAESEASPPMDGTGSSNLFGRARSNRNSKGHSRNKSHDGALNLTRSQSQASEMESRDFEGDSNSLRSHTHARRSDQISSTNIENLQTRHSFADAKEWYAAAAEYQGGKSPFSTNAGTGWKYGGDRTDQSMYTPTSPLTPYQLQPTPQSDTFETPFIAPHSPIEPAQTKRDVTSYFDRPIRVTSSSPRRDIHGRPDDSNSDDKSSFIQESHYEDASEDRCGGIDDSVAATLEEQIFLNEVLEESLQEEPEIEAQQQPDPVQAHGEFERHEDRADAFDYENFFLHSALGNYPQSSPNVLDFGQARTGSRASFGSSGSGETARAAESDLEDDPPNGRGKIRLKQRLRKQDRGTFLDDDVPTPTDARPNFAVPHFRNRSVDSVSTAATFSTATEAHSTSNVDLGDRDDDQHIPSKIFNWGGQSSLIGGWPSPPAHMPGHSSVSTPTNGHKSPSQEGLRGEQTSYFLSPHEYDSLTRAGDSEENVRRATPHRLVAPAVPRQGPDSLSASKAGDETDQPKTEGEGGMEERPSEPPLPTAEILLSSLITLVNPDFQSDAPFSELDEELVVNLLQSVGAVCEGINQVSQKNDASEKAHLLRQRLDLARRVLDGEGDDSA